jgi:alkanesulfonate monooxygenase SsuD/methylene tetrahydromethanopterin reductase-like flavin-dependent oxidoreductase (luciferase family)
MKFGLWHDLRNPPRWHRPYDVLYRGNLEQIEWAEELGFESAWLSEHHLTDDGYREAEFEALGVPISERARRTEELIEVARRAWAGELELTVTPPPAQQPEPPFWVGGSTAAAARRAARLRCNFMPVAYVATQVLQLYRELADGEVSINPSVHERTRCDRLFFWARPPGLAIELSNRSLELFAKEVIPRVEAAART